MLVSPDGAVQHVQRVNQHNLESAAVLEPPCGGHLSCPQRMVSHQHEPEPDNYGRSENKPEIGTHQRHIEAHANAHEEQGQQQSTERLVSTHGNALSLCDTPNLPTRCGHDGQRKRVAHMRTATTATQDSRSKMGQNHPHDFTKRLNLGTRVSARAPRGSFHAPICPQPAITLSRKDWHSSVSGAVLSPFQARGVPRDPAPPAAWQGGAVVVAANDAAPTQAE
jgi:hypothetical protein